MKHLIAIVLLSISTLASAGTWVTSKDTAFNGTVTVYQVMSGPSGMLQIDEQQKYVALLINRNSGVLSYVKGVKVDGVYYEAKGRASIHDHWTSIVFASERYYPELYAALRTGKNIELNVYWNGERNQVMKF